MISTKAFNEALRYQVNQLGNVVRGLEMIAEHLEQHWSHGAYQTLAKDCRRLLSHIPPGRLSPTLVTRLQALSLLRTDEDPGTPDVTGLCHIPTHAVLVLLVDQHPQPSGLVRELWVEPVQTSVQSAGFAPEADEDFRQALVAGCLAAGRILEQVGILPVSSLPEDYVFHIAPGTFGENPRLQERSGWLASALSYVAWWGGLTMPGVIAATGFCESHGQLGDLRGVTAKIVACLRERPEVDKILVLSREPLPYPYSGDPRVIPVGSLEDAIQAVWGTPWRTRLLPPKPSIYAAVEKALYIYGKEGNFPEALRRFEVLSRFFAQASQFPPRYRFLCDWRRASCYTHLGRPDRASALFQQWVPEVEALWGEGEISAEDYVNFFASYGVYLQDVFAFAQGAAVLGTLLDQRAEHRVTRLQRAKLLGTQGQLLMFHGDFVAAEHALLHAYQLIEAEEKPRNCTYLAQLYTLWGRFANCLALPGRGPCTQCPDGHVSLASNGSITSFMGSGRPVCAMQAATLCRPSPPLRPCSRYVPWITQALWPGSGKGWPIWHVESRTQGQPRYRKACVSMRQTIFATVPMYDSLCKRRGSHCWSGVCTPATRVPMAYPFMSESCAPR